MGRRAGWQGEASFSADGRYRFWLRRREAEAGPPWRYFCVMGLNPSKAGAEHDDPTIRRDLGFAMANDCNVLLKANLFPMVSTDPKGLWAQGALPLGNGPDFGARVVMTALREHDGYLVCAWGTIPAGAPSHFVKLRAKRIKSFDRLMMDYGHTSHCLGVTKDGSPRHTLYLAKTTVLQPYVIPT